MWILAYWSILRVPLKFRPDFKEYMMMYVLTLSFATQCSIGVFLASRGPLWALGLIGAWQLPALGLNCSAWTMCRA